MTAIERIKSQLGELIVANASLAEQNEILSARVIELEEKEKSTEE